MPEILRKPDDLIDRLAATRAFASMPREELAWLAANGELRHYALNEIVITRNDPPQEMIVILGGRSQLTYDRGTGHRHTVETKAGFPTGLLPYSRLAKQLGDVTMVEEGDALAIHKDKFRGLITECPTITTKLVHTMLDRARNFAAMNWSDEKLLSLGRLAAGLAHELNNPASAAARGAQLLDPTLQSLGQAAFSLGEARLTAEQRALVDALVERSIAPAGVLSAIERADREEALSDWLDAHAGDTSIAAALAEHGITPKDLDALASKLEGRPLAVALQWLAAANLSHGLATDVARSASRIHDLVGAVKRFSYVDRGGAAEPTDVARGLTDTVAVLASKARDRSVKVTLDLATDLPRVTANTAALNQVWANLLENALDAAPSSGTVSVHAARTDGHVVVRVIDDGPGIPQDVQLKMFEPFYTTKKIGEGSGLGLDIARRVVHSLEGQIEVDTRPGRTEFRVSIPVGAQAS